MAFVRNKKAIAEVLKCFITAAMALGYYLYDNLLATYLIMKEGLVKIVNFSLRSCLRYFKYRRPLKQRGLSHLDQNCRFKSAAILVL